MTQINVWVLILAVVTALVLRILVVALTTQRTEGRRRSPERAAREERVAHEENAARDEHADTVARNTPRR